MNNFQWYYLTIWHWLKLTYALYICIKCRIYYTKALFSKLKVHDYELVNGVRVFHTHLISYDAGGEILFANILIYFDAEWFGDV